MKKMMKFAGAAFSLVLAVGLGVGGTLAWLTDKTDPVINTFTAGSIALTLDETNVDGQPTDSSRDTSNSYELMPGRTIEKDPVVHVAAGSEDSIVFVKVQNELEPILKLRADGKDDIQSQMKENGWLPLGETAPDVYYYHEVVKQSEDIQNLNVFQSFQIREDAVGDNQADSKEYHLSFYLDKKITVTAYASQAEGLVADTLDQAEALKAWNANFKD